MLIPRLQADRLRLQMHQAEAWLAERNQENARLRAERDAATLELAQLRRQQQSHAAQGMLGQAPAA